MFLSYRRPRAYNPVKTELMVEATEPVEIRPFNVAVGVAAILLWIILAKRKKEDKEEAKR